MSRWLVALGALCVLTAGTALAGDRNHPARGARAMSEPAPLLVTDPSTGASIRIWSRDDGFAAKIAWARNDGSGWGPSHDLTFGLGIDRDPAVTVTSAGAWLFWRDDRGGVFYAPIDLGSGRLLAVPASLLQQGRAPNAGPRPEGTTDVPVVLNCEPGDSGCIAQPLRPPSNPGQPNPTAPPVVKDGTTDVPVTICGSNCYSGASSGSTVVTASNPSCERQIVSVVQGNELLVSELDGAGRVRGQHTVRVGKGIRAEQAGPAAAQFFIQQTCN